MSKSPRRSLVRLLQISILTVGLFLLGFPEGQTVTEAWDCYETCVTTDDGHPGCAEYEPGLIENWTGTKCHLWEWWSEFGEILIEAGCEDFWCGQSIGD